MNRHFARGLTLCFAIFAAGLVCGAPVQAKSATDVHWGEIETVTVRPSIVSPAMWHVRKGTSELWLISTIPMMPEGVRWNDSEIAEKFKDAQIFYVEPVAETGMISDMVFSLTHSSSLPDGQHLADYLSATDQSRLARAMSQTGIDTDDYIDLTPQAAALKLRKTFPEEKGLETDAVSRVQDRLSDVADDHDVDTKTIGNIDIKPALRAFMRLPAKQATSCLVAALDDVDGWNKELAIEANAWSIGDVAGQKAHYTPDHFSACLGRVVPAFGEAEAHRMRVLKWTVKKALRTPGKTVMLMTTGHLLAEGGVIEMLSRQGFKVEQVSTKIGVNE